jgi:hypothetical protein
MGLGAAAGGWGGREAALGGAGEGGGLMGSGDLEGTTVALGCGSTFFCFCVSPAVCAAEEGELGVGWIMRSTVEQLSRKNATAIPMRAFKTGYLWMSFKNLLLFSQEGLCYDDIVIEKLKRSFIFKQNECQFLPNSLNRFPLIFKVF